MVFLRIIPKKNRLFGVCCGFFIAIGGVAGWIILPYLVVKLIDLNVILFENSDQYQRWHTLPQPMDFKIYIFNVTNADEIQKGALPIVKEIGPYIYKQYRIKNVENISSDQMSITYTSKQIYKFDRKQSYPFKENDKIVVLNVAMNVILHIKDEEIRRVVRKVLQILNGKAEQTPIVGSLKRLIEIFGGNRKVILPRMLNCVCMSCVVSLEDQVAVLQISEDIINSQLGLINKYIFRIFPNQSSLFIQTTPKRFFFDGIPFCMKGDQVTVIICRIVEDIVKHRNIKAIRKMTDGSLNFAFFYYKNNSHDGSYKVLSGFNDSKLTSRILTWQGKSHLTAWTDEGNSISNCNLLERSTDGLFFPPHLKPEGSLKAYSTDICRTVELYYKKMVTYRNIIGYRFETGDNFLNKIGSKYSTKCFCITTLDKIPKYSDGCLYKGLLDLTLCHGAPIILSMPHLHGCAPEYQTVRGLKPNLERGITYVDIEPNTGYPLRGYKRAQFNMFVRKVDKVDFTSNLKTFLMPIIWVDEGTQLNDKMIKMLNDKMFTPLLFANILIYTAIGSGSLVFCVCLMRLWKCSSRKNVSQEKIIAIRPVQH